MANNILFLSKKFDSHGYIQHDVKPSMYEGKTLSVTHIDALIADLKKVDDYWNKQTLLGDMSLVSVYCYSVVAKSNRIEYLFKIPRKKTNDLLVGARFREDDNKNGHLFTYCFEKKYIKTFIERLEKLKSGFLKLFGNSVSKDQLILLNETIQADSFSCYAELNKTSFFKIVQEISYIESIDVYMCDEIVHAPSTVSFFETGLKLSTLLRSIGIRISENDIEGNTALLDEKDFNVVKDKAGYLISMQMTDFSQINLENKIVDKKATIDELKLKLPKPNNEPYIGVIDTLFNTNVYFSKWVEYEQLYNNKYATINDEDYAHGTAVSSLIVDLPSLNPDLDDGCGRFRVKHFGVCLKRGGVSTFRIMKQIIHIVEANPDVHVWNLSLGSEEEISINFISPEAFILDQLQVKFPDVIFVVSGTNLPATKKKPYKIGSPADSINSIVVNSVKRKTLEPVSYSRNGPVLSFFIKPDVSYYGGDYDDPIVVAYPFDTVKTFGTSFAAPLIARKLAYMIDILKIPRNCAKALLIDSCVGWNRGFDMSNSFLVGRGVVPINIRDIVTTEPDEMRVFITGVSEDYCSYEYNFPVPFNSDDKYPYFARATLCYFPSCKRNQGVDYTDTELNLKFGRTKETRSKKQSAIQSIVEDCQNKEGFFTRENEARAMYRKWDNIKILAETYKDKGRPRKKYDRNNWGIEISYTERDSGTRHPISWGLVISLKAMDGVNRFDQFKQSCQLNNWIVNEISIDEKVTAFVKGNVDIEWE